MNFLKIWSHKTNPLSTCEARINSCHMFLAVTHIFFHKFSYTKGLFVWAFGQLQLLPTALNCFQLLPTAHNCLQLLTTAHDRSQPLLTASYHFQLLSNCFPVAYNRSQLLTTAPNCLQLLSTALNCSQPLITAHNYFQPLTALCNRSNEHALSLNGIRYILTINH